MGLIAIFIDQFSCFRILQDFLCLYFRVWIMKYLWLVGESQQMESSTGLAATLVSCVCVCVCVVYVCVHKKACTLH